MLKIHSVKKEKKGKGILWGRRRVVKKKKYDKEVWQTFDAANRSPIFVTFLIICYITSLFPSAEAL